MSVTKSYFQNMQGMRGAGQNVFRASSSRGREALQQQALTCAPGFGVLVALAGLAGRSRNELPRHPEALTTSRMALRQAFGSPKQESHKFPSG